jgi:hypothetical protein
MSRVWALVMGSRAWLIGVLMWLVAASLVYAQNDNQRPAAVLGLLLTFLVGGTGPGPEPAACTGPASAARHTPAAPFVGS